VGRSLPTVPIGGPSGALFAGLFSGTFCSDEGAQGFAQAHIACMRTKLDPAAGAIGAKLAFYSDWATCSTVPNSSPPDPEFYDYSINTSETGNVNDSGSAITSVVPSAATTGLVEVATPNGTFKSNTVFRVHR
jgi:hypothetical protein